MNSANIICFLKPGKELTAPSSDCLIFSISIDLKICKAHERTLEKIIPHINHPDGDETGFIKVSI